MQQRLNLSQSCQAHCRGAAFFSHAALRFRSCTRRTESTSAHAQTRQGFASRTCSCAALSGAKKAKEWSELAVMPDDNYVREEDPAFQEDINRLCTHGLKAMLKEDGRAVSEWQDELNQWGNHFAEENDRNAAIFMYTLYQMSDHKLPTDSLQLKGMYLKAFEKMFNVLEDSGWQLKSPDDEEHSDDEEAAGSADILPGL